MVEGEKRGRLGGKTPNPYYEARKYPEPTVCSGCGLIYKAGRWQPPQDTPSDLPANQSACPACRREADRMPAGLLYLSGSYLDAHREEILNIARNQSRAAAAQRPLQRIMWISESTETTEIATTNSHLALRIGHAIADACKGELITKHADEAQLVRVYWTRSDSS